MSFWSFLNQWWNLPYLVMLGLVTVFFGIQAFGLAAHGDTEVDHDLEHDLDHDGEADHDHETDADGEGDSIFGARVPFMVRWLTLFVFSGFAGLFFNRVLQVKTGVFRPWFFPFSLLAALTVGVFAVRFVSRGVAKLVDTGGRGATRRMELEGTIGIVASSKLDASFGEVRIKDGRGNELIVHGHVADGDKALEQGSKVVLVELDEHSGLFQVAALKE
jgi:hypothetical protein